MSGEQLRAKCTIYNDPNERGLVGTPAKGLYYCLREKSADNTMPIGTMGCTP